MKWNFFRGVTAQNAGRRWLAIVLLFCSTPAWANYACLGTIDAVALNPGGIVTVTSNSSGPGVFYVCNIGSTANGVAPEQCKAIYASLLAARMSAQNVAWTFNDALTCTTHPTWSWLTGWYYGPELTG